MTQIALEDRPKLYYNIDGVGELGFGFMSLGFSLLGWFQANAPKDSAWHQMYVFVIYMVAMLSIIQFGSKAIKKHITYPRTGFVEYRKRGTLWRPLIVSLSMSVVIAVAIAVRYRLNLNAPVSLFGLLLAALYAWNIGRAVRWKLAVAVMMAAGSLVIAALPRQVIAGLAEPPWLGAFWLTFAYYGTLAFISGCISFWLYLRHTKPPVREAE